MIIEGYRYQFTERVRLRDAEDTLLLSLLAVEGLYGEAQVRMDVDYALDQSICVLVVDASTEVGQDLNAIFNSFLLRGFGRDAFDVRRIVGLAMRVRREDCR